jgi:hypothetical protein
VFALTAGRAILEPAPGATAQVAVRRFARESFPFSVGTLSGSAELAIPPDRSARPWQVQVDGRGPVTVCRSPAPQLAASPSAPTL